MIFLAKIVLPTFHTRHTIVGRHFIYRVLSLAFIHAEQKSKLQGMGTVNPPELMSKSIIVRLTLYICKQHLIHIIIKDTN